MATSDWVVTPADFEVRSGLADVIVVFQNVALGKSFKEHVFCHDLESLKIAVLVRLSQFEETDSTAELKPIIGHPLDLAKPAEAEPTDLEKFKAEVLVLEQLGRAIALKVLPGDNAEYVAHLDKVAAGLAANPSWFNAF